MISRGRARARSQGDEKRVSTGELFTGSSEGQGGNAFSSQGGQKIREITLVFRELRRSGR
jgi:hypothetical protein